jgi:hypothetical protein
MINDWAICCSPCLEEVPALVALHDERKANDLMDIDSVFDGKMNDKKSIVSRNQLEAMRQTN